MKQNYFFLTMLTLLFSQSKSMDVNSFAHVHLPFSHIPELLLPVHCLLTLQNPPTGTVSEMINNDNLRIEKSKEKNTAKHNKH